MLFYIYILGYSRVRVVLRCQYVHRKRKSPDLELKYEMCCVVFSSHLFWTSNSLEAPAGVTQDSSSTFLLRCVPLFFSREGFSRSFPSSTVKSNLCNTNDLIVPPLLGIFFSFFFSEGKSQLPGFELTSQRVRRLRGYQLSYREKKGKKNRKITIEKRKRKRKRKTSDGC